MGDDAFCRLVVLDLYEPAIGLLNSREPVNGLYPLVDGNSHLFFRFTSNVPLFKQ